MELGDGVDETEFAKEVLVENPRAHVVASHDELALAAGIAAPIVGGHLCAVRDRHGRATVGDVFEDGGEHLLPRPQRRRLEHRRRGHRHRFPGGGAAALIAPGEIHQRQVHQLLELSAVEERVAFRQQHARAHVILNQTAEGFPVRRHGILLIGANNLVRLGATEVILRKVQVHLVAVEIGIVRGTVRVVHADRALALEHARGVRHDAGLVQRRLAIDQQHVAVAKMTVHLLRQRSSSAARRRRRRRRRFRALRALTAFPAGDPRRCRGRRAGGGGGRGEERFRDCGSTLSGEPVEVNHSSSFVLDGVGAGVHLRSVLHKLAHELDVVRGNMLGEGELGGEHGRDANLGGSDVGIGHDDGARGVIDALAHHVHAKQTLLLLELLTDADAAGVATLRLAAVDELVHAPLEGEPGAHGALRAHLRRLGNRRGLAEKLGERQVRLDDGVEVCVLRVLEHHVPHARGRTQATRSHQYRLHEEPRGVASSLGRRGRARAGRGPERGRVGHPHHRAKIVLGAPEFLQKRASLDGRHVHLTPGARGRTGTGCARRRRRLLFLFLVVVVVRA